MYVNIRREDTSPEATNRYVNKYGHVVLGRSIEADIDHLIRRLATSRKQVPKEDALASIRAYSPRSWVTRQSRIDKEAILAEGSWTVKVNTDTTTFSTPHTSKTHENSRLTKGRLSKKGKSLERIQDIRFLVQTQCGFRLKQGLGGKP